MLGSQIIHDLAPADLAEPSEERGLATEIRELAHRLAERGLHHFAGRLHIAAHARQCKPVKTREMAREKSVEGALVTGEHAPHELRFVDHSRVQAGSSAPE